MKLVKVFLGAFKSIINAELDVTEGCVGLVGINESGKSNVLKAIKTLSTSNILSEGDVPKKNKKSPAYMRFDFCLYNEEIEAIKNVITKEFHLDKIPKELLPQDMQLSYHVEYSPLDGQEKRYFSIPGIKFPSNHLVLNQAALTKSYKFLKGEEFLPLEKIVIITEDDFKKNEALSTTSSRVTDIEEEIEVLKEEMSSFVQSNNVSGEPETAPLSVSNSNKIKKVKSQIDRLESEKSFLIKTVADFDLDALIGEREEKAEKVKQSIDATNKNISEFEKKIEEFPNLAIPEDQKKRKRQINRIFR